MNSGRISFALLLSVLLMVGQWPLSVMGESLLVDRQSHCHAQTHGEHCCGAESSHDTCHSKTSPGHCSQGCDCDSACTGCSSVVVGFIVERFQTGTANKAMLFLSQPDGLVFRAISPAKRPPRFLLA